MWIMERLLVVEAYIFLIRDRLVHSGWFYTGEFMLLFNLPFKVIRYPIAYLISRDSYVRDEFEKIRKEKLKAK